MSARNGENRYDIKLFLWFSHYCSSIFCVVLCDLCVLVVVCGVSAYLYKDRLQFIDECLLFAFLFLG